MTKKRLKEKLSTLVESWQKHGLPSHEALEKEAERIIAWKKKNKIDSLWEKPPLMITATMDDGMGIGLKTIHLYAGVLGIELMPLGLLKTPDDIIEQAKMHRPQFLGLTVLQLDTEDDLTRVAGNLPEETTLIAGGPVFKADPDLARRAGVDRVAENVAVYITHMLNDY